MRPRILFAAFALFAGASGCGGCDSCFGTGSGVGPVAEDARPTTQARPASADAQVGAAEDAAADGGRDAAPFDAAGTPFLVQSSLPRPVPPPSMAMGHFQSCGNYDTPLCEKECPKGNCRQECDGTTCTLGCVGGYCSQLCGERGKCRLTCQGGHCVQACSKAEDCVKECAGGNCK